MVGRPVTEYRIEEGSLVTRVVQDPNGEQHMFVVPLEAISSRMALLGLDDPGAGLSAVFDELDNQPEGSPYVEPYGRLQSGQLPDEASVAQARSIMPMVIGVDPPALAQVKEQLRGEFAEKIERGLVDFVLNHMPPRTIREVEEEILPNLPHLTGDPLEIPEEFLP